MRAGDRARTLIGLGVDPYVGADYATGTQITYMSGPGPMALAGIGLVGFVIGALVVALVGYEAGAGHVVTPTDWYNLKTLHDAGVDEGHPLPADLSLRLAVPMQNIGTVARILAGENAPEPDMTWVQGLDGAANADLPLPSRLSAFHYVVTYLARIEPTRWPGVLDGWRAESILSEGARSLLALLRDIKHSDIEQVQSILNLLIKMPPEQRNFLVESGFPPVPRDPERQQVFKMLLTIDHSTAFFIYDYLVSNRDNKIMMERLKYLLVNQTFRRALGALFAKNTTILHEIASLPPECDMIRVNACQKIER